MTQTKVVFRSATVDRVSVDGKKYRTNVELELSKGEIDTVLKAFPDDVSEGKPGEEVDAAATGTTGAVTNTGLTATTTDQE